MNLDYKEGNIIQKISEAYYQDRLPQQIHFFHDIFLTILNNLSIDDRTNLMMVNKTILKYCIKIINAPLYNDNSHSSTNIIRSSKMSRQNKKIFEIEKFSLSYLNKIKNNAVSRFSGPLAGKTMRPSEVFPDSKPFTRWWWLKGPFKEVDIKAQLLWIKKQGFGGVELAWLFPSWDTPNNSFAPSQIKWLSNDFKKTLALTKKCAEKLGLGCDFTFGSSWPFGGSFLAPEDCAHTFKGPSAQEIWDSWEVPKHPPVLNHLSRTALEHYIEHMRGAFEPALKGRPSSLFCDSLEISNDTVWSPNLWKKFEERFGYSLTDHMDELDTNPHIRYDSRKIVSEAILSNFYQPFTELSHLMGAKTRVQCHGAPTDLLSAYASVDIPESESILFDPWFSRIPASAASLASCSVISCETFTCLYGFVPPPKSIRREQVKDLKLLFDAVVANGVNQIVWHGMPFNSLKNPINEFFASVHVGPDAYFANQLSEFNQYMTNTCGLMRLGTNAHRMAVYLPNEDMMMLGELPRDLQKAGGKSHWEMRYVLPPKETEGFLPIWLSGDMLSRVDIINGNLCCGNMNVPLLYIEAEWVDVKALTELLRIVKKGGRIVLNKKPKQPGFLPLENYEAMVKELLNHTNTLNNLKEANITPLLQGEHLPPYWAREYKGELYLFLAHPSTADVKYPLRYCQNQESTYEERKVKVIHGKNIIDLELQFAPGDAIMLQIAANGKVTKLNLESPP
ncbi:MAG: hypothetical protein H0T62_05520 [Parachlamydiaceae bacterium]|nr:hypothetical protein [Parachlamydiaceae bacterium]